MSVSPQQVLRAIEEAKSLTTLAAESMWSETFYGEHVRWEGSVVDVREDRSSREWFEDPDYHVELLVTAGGDKLEVTVIRTHLRSEEIEFLKNLRRGQTIQFHGTLGLEPWKWGLKVHGAGWRTSGFL